jgi:mersacidin/lichenicidin family type 2 lantibiotic
MPKKPSTRAFAGSDHPLVRIYISRALEPAVEITSALAADFFKRPHHYHRVPEGIAALLSDFQSLSGNHPEWPDSSQRTLMVTKVLSRFGQSLASIRRAAIAFVQRVPSHSTPIASDLFIEEVVRLRVSVQPLEGVALSTMERRNTAMLERALTVLTSPEVSAAFGLPVVPAGNWPDGGLYSPQLAYLCESVSRTLALDKPISQPRFSAFQRAAHYGAITIGGVLDSSFTESNSDRFSVVIQAAASWAAALRELLFRIDIVRAWRNPAYRDLLQVLERDLLPPHPAGEIDLAGSGLSPGGFPQLAFAWYDTQTVDGEICCCSGDGCETSNCVPGPSDDCPTQTHDCNGDDDDGVPV